MNRELSTKGTQNKAYPKYKPSGVEWLGDVPEHWGVKRIDFLASVKARLGWKGLTADEYVQEGFIFLSTPNIKGENDIAFRDVNYISKERYFESPEIILKEGDVILAKDGSTLGTVNRVKSLPAPATVNSSLAVIRPKSTLNSEFLFRWIASPIIQSLIGKFKDGQGVPHLFQADIRKFLVLFPPLPEQQAIAAFLDRETGRIDTLIAKKQRLLELLAEQRTALISSTVTKGLDAKVKLKPSGVEWLGDVPEHWEVKKIVFLLSKIQDGTHFSPESDFSGDYLYITAKNIKEWGFDFSEITYVSKEAHQEIYKRCPVKKGDVLYIKDGATAGIATVNNLDDEFSMLSSVAMLRPKYRELNSRYLAYHLNSRGFKNFALNN